MDSPSPNPPETYISSEKVRDAVIAFRQASSYEKELSSDSQMIGHMTDFVLGRVLIFLLEGKTEDDIIQFITNALQSFRSYRRGHMTSNPVRTYQRDRDQL